VARIDRRTDAEEITLALDNPVLSKSPYFNGQAPRVGETASADQLRAMYDQPAAAEPTVRQAGSGFGGDGADITQPLSAAERMSYDGVIVKTAGLFAVLLAGAAIGWFFPGLMMVGVIGGLVLGLINSFKREPSVPLILAYGAAEGLFIGGISSVFAQTYYGGIVMQAVLATLCVFGVTLALFVSGKVRASARGAKILLIAMVGYLVFGVVNLILSMTGAVTDPFGLYGAHLFGIPVAALVGVLVVIMAAYSLVLDFDQIQTGVRAGAPAKYGWTAAFGLVVTLVWLYIEFLRLFAVLASNRE
jgi:uncharacterized YccA/Bax inhibitor family protein